MVVVVEHPNWSDPALIRIQARTDAAHIPKNSLYTAGRVGNAFVINVLFGEVIQKLIKIIFSGTNLFCRFSLSHLLEFFNMQVLTRDIRSNLSRKFMNNMFLISKKK